MDQYVSGKAAWAADNIISECADGSRSMILPGAFDDFDFDTPVAILVDHDWNQRIGTVGDNATMWMDGSKLMFSVRLKNNCTSDVFSKPNWQSELTGCSINCTGFSETRYDSRGRAYSAMLKVLAISDVGPVAHPADPFCHGITLTDYSPAPRRTVNRPMARKTTATTMTNQAIPWKMRKKLINLGPPPGSYFDGVRLMAAAQAGEGCKIGNRMLSASVVQNMLAGGRMQNRIL